MICYKRALVTVNAILPHPAQRCMSLNGSWEFQLDPEDKGLPARWFDAGVFSGRIEVPGSWQGQGFGNSDKDMVWFLKLQTRTFRATYTGTAWHARRFQVPDDWKALRVWVNFGGVHPSAEVWLNGIRLGDNHEPFVPFGFEITEALSFGAENLLVVRVHEKSRAMGFLFNWQGNWSGLYRGVELTATGPSFLERFCAHPNVDRACLMIKARVGGLDSSRGPLTLRLAVRPIGQNSAGETSAPVTSCLTELEVPVPSPQLWSPDTPNLYRVDAVLSDGNQVLDCLSERIGFVKLSAKGKQILINGEAYYMRGTGDFVSNPETGCPDIDRDRWRKKLSTLRKYGYNYVRCQSFVPAPEYFDVADEVGLLVQSEMGMLGAVEGGVGWNVRHGYNWPLPTPDNRKALKAQWDHVVMRDVNHPSANIYCMSNELWNGTLYPRIAWQCYRDTKTIKPSAFVIWTDGGYNPDLPSDFVNGEATVDTPLPLIQHEFRWWISFPDVRIMHKYSGAVRPYAAEIAIEAATHHGIAHVLPQAAANSQRLQFIEAKGKMEICRRDNSQLAGISHFMAMDLNCSPQGIVDEFYERKCTDSTLWLETNGDTVVLSSLGFDDRVLSAGETLHCSFSVSDFSHPPLREPILEWKLAANDEILAAGRIAYSHKPYLTCPVGRIEVDIPHISRPRVAKLQVALREDKRVFTNHWDLWLFPNKVQLPASLVLYGEPGHTWLKSLNGLPAAVPADLAGTKRARVVLTERLDDTLVAFARTGGRIILAASEGLLRPFLLPRLPASEKYFFSVPANDPPFEEGHTGTIITNHPMLGDMPHDGFADLQFFRLMSTSPALDLEPLGLNSGDPVIRVMQTYVICHPLAYLVECSLGRGTIILCALNLDQSLSESRYLLAQICNHAAGNVSQPMLELSDDVIVNLISETAIP